MSTPPFSSSRKFLCAWLAFGVALWGVAMYLQSQFPMPVVGSYQYALKPAKSNLIWIHDPHDFEPSAIYQLDLKTGKISTAPYRSIVDYGQVNSRGQRFIFTRQKLAVVEHETGKLLWSGPTPGRDPDQMATLVGDKYLVETLTEQFSVTDLDVLTGLGPNPIGPSVDATAAQKLFDVPGVKVQSMASAPMPISGTNRFIYHFANTKPEKVAVYEVEDGELKQIASWPTGATTVVLYEGTILTASLTGPEIEVRSSTDFKLLKKYPMPAGLGAWTDGGNGITTRNDLFSFVNIKAGKICLGRLDDFSTIPGLDLSVGPGGIKTAERDDRRYVMLVDSYLMGKRLAVYDSVDRRVAVERAPPQGSQDIRIVDGHLVTVTEEAGLTVEMTNLETGKVSRVYQPVAWVIRAGLVVLLLALVWLIVWVRATRHWPRLAVPNVVLVLALFGTPQLAHMVWLGNWRVFYRPALGYGVSLLLVFCFLMSAYAVFGRLRLLLRQVPIWISLAAVLGVANTYVDDQGKRGLNGLPVALSECMRLAMAFTIVSCLLLYAMKWLRFRVMPRAAGAEEVGPREPSVWLLDIFLLTAAIAAFVAAVMPNGAFLIQPMPWVAFAVASAFYAIPTFLGLLALVRSPIVFRRSASVAIALAFFLIGEFTMHLWLANHHREIWYNVFVAVRYFIFIFLATFLVGALLRPSYLLARTRNGGT